MSEMNEAQNQGYLLSMRMTRNMYEELTDCSLVSAWRVLRRHCLTEILGPEYCPVPDIDTSQYFDMNDVFAVIMKARLKELFGDVQPQFRYVAKLRDMLKFKSDQHRAIVKNKAAMHDIDNELDRRFEVDLQMTRDGVKKQLFASIAKMKTIGTDLNWDVGDDAVDAFVDRRPTMLDKSVRQIIVVSRVVIGYGLQIRYGCDVSEDQVREWNAAGPIPVAFQAIKFKVKKKDGRLVRMEVVPTEQMFNDDNWIVPAGHPLKCAVLDAYLEDGTNENIALDNADDYELL